MSEHIERVVLEQKGLYPNVDFYSASTYHYLGIETGLFTPIFAMSRVVGWAAHVIEQHCRQPADPAELGVRRAGRCARTSRSSQRGGVSRR